MKKTPHVIWVCPNSQLFFRSKGEVKARPGSVIPKLIEQGFKIDVLIPHDPSLLPKSKLAPSRVTKHEIKLSQTYRFEITKLTRGSNSPGIFMAKLPILEAPLYAAIFSKAAMALAKEINKPVDVFHLFGWEAGLLPLYLELEKSGSRIFQNTRTFFSVGSLRNQGNFSPGILNYIGIPKELFHPEGIEFFGKVSFLKTGFVFADGVGLIEETSSLRNGFGRSGTGLEGLLDSIAFKLRRWASDRSIKVHSEAYAELMAMKKISSLLPHLLKKLHSTKDEAQRFIESWGPVPPDRYQTNVISFLMQSPRKAYAFWEWTGTPFTSYALALEDLESGSRVVLERNLPGLGDFWVDVNPGRKYAIELLGVSHGSLKTLLRSNVLSIARNSLSPNTEAIFIDVKSRQKVAMQPKINWEKQGKRQGEGSAAWEWTTAGWAHSLELTKK